MTESTPCGYCRAQDHTTEQHVPFDAPGWTTSLAEEHLPECWSLKVVNGACDCPPDTSGRTTSSECDRSAVCLAYQHEPSCRSQMSSADLAASGRVCSQPDPTNEGQPCWQQAAYSVRLTGFHGVPGEQEVEVCADHLAWWREAFPDSILAARSLPGSTA